ncbi:MAG: hypothetical protein KDB24_16500, partial [Microthrixaceae bacterium]|nr:hypothetical protein [Microthrixaceae bacterium]
WRATPAGAAPAAPCRAGDTRVSVVVDYGTVSGNSSPSATCITITQTMNGAQFLAARAQALGTPAPTYGPSGLLCSIDGYPASGCGERSGGNYLYWSYWNGSSGRWVYSNQGPASRRMTANSVEGWRFVRGGGGASDPAPRVAPNRTAICPPVTQPTAPPATQPRTAATAAPATRAQTQATAAPAPRAATPQQATPAAQAAPAQGQATNQAAPAQQPSGQPAAAQANQVPATPETQSGATAPATAGGSATTSTTKKPATTTTASDAKKASTTTSKQRSTTTSATKPNGGPTTLADSDQAAGTLTNVVASGRLPEDEGGGSGGTWLGLAVVAVALGAVGFAARKRRQRNLG